MRKVRSEDLIGVARGTRLPFLVTLESADSGELCEYRCEEILRVLPGRRLVLGARRVGKRLDGCLDERVVLKLFAGSGRQRYLERERRGLGWLEEAGVLVPGVVDRLRGTDVVGLALRYLMGAAPVTANDQSGVEQVAGMLGRMHRAGIWQSDLHLHNFLMSDGRAYAIDGDGVRRRTGSLSRGAGLENLALLAAQRPPAEDRGISGLVSAYSQVRDLASVDEQKFGSLLVKARQGRIRRYLSKTRRNCTEYAVTHSWRENAFAVRGDGERSLAMLLDNPRQLVDAGQILKAGNSATVVRIECGASIVVKRYNVKSSSHGLRRSMRLTPRFRRAWSGGQLLHFLRIPTARPLALLEERTGPLRGVAYLVMRDLGTRDLRTEVAQQGLSERRCEEVTDLFVQLKAAGLSHGDTKATNFLVHEGALHLIDLDALRVDSKMSILRSKMSTFRPKMPFLEPKSDATRFLENWPAAERIRFEASFRKAGLL